MEKRIPIFILPILLILSKFAGLDELYRWANTPPEKRKFLRKSQLWSQDFTAKLFCDVEFWIDRLPKLIEAQSEFERAGK